MWGRDGEEGNVGVRMEEADIPVHKFNTIIEQCTPEEWGEGRERGEGEEVERKKKRKKLRTLVSLIGVAIAAHTHNHCFHKLC